MRLVAVMPLWGRPALTALVLRQWWYQIHRLRGTVDLHLVCVGSEGPRSAALVNGYADGVSYCEADNAPLNRKWQKGVDIARTMAPDAVVIVGSDDLVSDSLFTKYAGLVAEGHDYFGLRDLYFFDAATQALGHWPGYGPGGQPQRAGEPVGCARCHSARVLARTDWQVWPQDPARNTVLDLTSLQHFARYGVKPEAFTLASLGAKAVDIKADTNITTFERLRFAHICRGPQALGYLADLCDEAALTELGTRWRQAA